MIPLLRRTACCLAATLAVALPASATTFSTDYSDLWFPPSESGWGLNLIQQNSVIFGTLYVYGTDNTPRWYVASDLESSDGGTTFTGTLYKTTGPYFGAPWTGGVTPVPTGSMTITFSSTSTATLVYTADGATVTKTIERFSARSDNLAGNYRGGIVANATNCNNSSNGAAEIFDTMTITHNGNQAVSATISFFTAGGVGSTCTMNGTYSQTGKLGNLAGTWGCSIGGTPYNNGTFTVTGLSATQDGLGGHFHGSDQFCQYDGHFGGVRDVQ